jgi:hypothetical protein
MQVLGGADAKFKIENEEWKIRKKINNSEVLCNNC